MQRLPSTFASGPPGLGLLLLRLIAAVTLIVQVIVGLRDGASLQAITLPVISAVGGALLLLGLWTPLGGAVVAIVELCAVLSTRYDPWMSVLLAGLGAALVLLGPGAWSVDARLYGWKRIKIRRLNE